MFTLHLLLWLYRLHCGHSSIAFQYCIPPLHSTDCRQPHSQHILCIRTSDISEGLKLGSHIKRREEWTEDITADSAQIVSVATPSPLGTRLEYSNTYRRSRKQYTYWCKHELTSQKHQVESLNVRCSNEGPETVHFFYQSDIQCSLSGGWNGKYCQHSQQNCPMWSEAKISAHSTCSGKSSQYTGGVTLTFPSEIFPHGQDWVESKLSLSWERIPNWEKTFPRW